MVLARMLLKGHEDNEPIMTVLGTNGIIDISQEMQLNQTALFIAVSSQGREEKEAKRNI